MKITIPEFLRDVLDRINKEGYEAYLVGGAVRDAILGKENKDYDLCTNMPLEEVSQLFPGFKIMKENDHRNTGTFRCNGEDVEITTFRGNSIKEDLSNRDFTINAIACDKDGNVVDYFHGVDDIRNKKIALVNKEGRGIDADPLRILRGIRFSGKLGFTIDEDTRRIFNEKKDLLDRVAVERIYTELKKIFVCDHISNIIRDNREIIFKLFPELVASYQFSQNNPYHVYDVFEHTLKVMDNTSSDFILRMAALFHDSGKPYTYSEDENGVGHFYGHPDASKNIFDSISRKYKFDEKTREAIKNLIFYHDIELSTKRSKMSKLLQKISIEDLRRLFLLKKADILGQNPAYYSRLEDLVSCVCAYDEFINEEPALKVSDLKINGRKLMELGHYGINIGKILNELLEMVTDEKVENSSEALEEYVIRHY